VASTRARKRKKKKARATVAHNVQDAQQTHPDQTGHRAEPPAMPSTQCSWYPAEQYDINYVIYAHGNETGMQFYFASHNAYPYMQQSWGVEHTSHGWAV
jgi:hypothetical protein